MFGKRKATKEYHTTIGGFEYIWESIEDMEYFLIMCAWEYEYFPVVVNIVDKY